MVWALKKTRNGWRSFFDIDVAPAHCLLTLGRRRTLSPETRRWRAGNFTEYQSPSVNAMQKAISKSVNGAECARTPQIDNTNTHLKSLAQPTNLPPRGHLEQRGIPHLMKSPNATCS